MVVVPVPMFWRHRMPAGRSKCTPLFFPVSRLEHARRSLSSARPNTARFPGPFLLAPDPRDLQTVNIREIHPVGPRLATVNWTNISTRAERDVNPSGELAHPSQTFATRGPERSAAYIMVKWQ